MSDTHYLPDYVSPPGNTLREALQERSMTTAGLAEQIGESIQLIHNIISGDAAFTPEIALQLEHVLGISATFWIRRERQYQQARARPEQHEIEEHARACW